MPTAAARVRLGDRYAALGLASAAAAAYQRAAEIDPVSPTAPRRLAELALERGDGVEARRWADEAARRKPGADARLLCARALVAAGELAAARFQFASVLEGAGVDARMRGNGYLGRADVAAREGDHAGALAHVLAAVEELALASPAESPLAAEEDARRWDEVASRAVALGQPSELSARFTDLEARRPDARLGLGWAALLAAEQARGSADIHDSDIEAALQRALGPDPTSRPIRLRLALRLSRRRYRDPSARQRAVSILEALSEELAAEEGDAADVERARVQFLLAGLYEDDAATQPRAEEAYRAGLKLRPRHAPAANNLALLALAKGDQVAARRELGRALRLDSSYDIAWRNVARLLDASRPASSFAEEVSSWLEAASPGAGIAGDVAAPMLRAAAEGATQAMLEALHAKGHRLKNLLGIAGARVRHLRKAIANREVGVELRLEEMERDLAGLYEEWAAHLRSMQAEGPRVEIVPVNPLVGEVVAAATQEGRPPLRFVPGSSLPDLRGDRALLREALMNLVTNALDAHEARGEREQAVEVTTRAVVSPGGAPAVEIDIQDQGGGIPRADLTRIFAPGYTTKPSGSGLGLAVADRVVAAHHGRIFVDSEEGHGTTVTVVLPSDLGGFSSLAVGGASRAEP
jgi:signal transduction histidine kinase